MVGIQHFITRKHFSIAAAILVMFSMPACSYIKPNAKLFNQVPEGGSVAYKKGWKEGCESGMALTGNQLYKAVYRNKVDPQLINDVQYYRGWNEARVYCAHYTMAVQWEAGVLPKTPTEEKSLLPQEPYGVFAVMATWGAPALFNFDDAPQEGEGFGYYLR